MKEKINELIPSAMKAITESGIADSTGLVKKEFKGYIASMGASIIQAGLLATLAFYNSKGEKKADSWKLLNVVFKLIKPSANFLMNTNGSFLIKYIIEHPDYKDTNKKQRFVGYIEEEIMDAIIAIKLALRTFKIEGNE